jgi:DNA polymerase-3 subunit epsilon
MYSINCCCKNKRPFKGKSIIDIPKDMVILDIETTGLDPDFDEIIEIGAIKIKNNKVIDNFSHLVKPDALINKFISNLTGITNAMLKNKDKINTVLPLFMKFINKNLLVGHNVNFDINFIYDKLEKLRMKPLSNNFIDTLRLSRQIHKELNHHRLVDMAEYYKISLDGHHRAYHDCLIILSLLNNLRTDIINKYGNIENFKLEKNKEKYRRKFKASDITTSRKVFNKDNLLYNKNVAITGKLKGMNRKNAMQIIADLGGHCQDRVTKITNYLVLGSNK